MIDFSHSLMGWNALFSLVLFGAALALGWLAIHTSFETTARTLAARATADLASVHAALAGLSDRVSRLEEQVAAITERLDRCEQVQLAKRGPRQPAPRSPRPPAAALPEAAEAPP